MPWQSPFALAGRWLKGNLHTHTTQSDGAVTPDEAKAWYRARGYDFLAITDHWVYSPGQETVDGLTILPGVELHGPGYHMLCLGLSDLPDRSLDDSPAELARAVVDLGGLAYYAHPYWTGQTSVHIASNPFISGIEVYNAVCDKMRGLGYSRVQWDEALAEGHRLTGVAVDDVHWKHGAAGCGYVMVRAQENTPSAILTALRDGAFYASTGPVIQDIAIVPGDGGSPHLRVRCSPCQDIVYYADGPKGYRFSAPEGSRLDWASFPIKEDQIYLRVECWDGRGGVAWTNPVYVTDVL